MTFDTTRRTVIRGVAAACVAAAAGRAIRPARAADAVSAAETEGQVVVYGDPFTLPLLVKGFGAKYPKIRVTSAPGDAWQMYNRFVAEGAAGRPLMDLMYQAEDTVITALQAGTLVPYITSEPDALLPLALPPDRAYVRGNGNLCLFAWNRDAMAKLPVPKDWTDFANPPAAWEGLVATTNPASSSATFAAVAGVYQHFGPDKGGDILKGLRKLRAELNPSMGVMSTKLQTGERPLDFFNITTASSGLIRQGAPIQLAIPTSGAVAQFNSIGISKTAPHPNAARLFADFAMSESMQATFADAGVYSLRKGIPAPKDLPSLTDSTLIAFDLPQALKDRDTILNWWSANTGFSYR